MKDEFVARVGVWGCGCPADPSAEGRSNNRAGRRDRRRYNHLKKKSPTVINAMRLIGTLEQYLTIFERKTQETYDFLRRKMFCVFAQMPHFFITKPLKSQP